MRDRRIMTLVGVLAAVLLTAPGCVGSKMFQSHVEDTDSRVTAVENAVERTQQEVDSLRRNTEEEISSVRHTANEAATVGNRALDKAESAEKAASGKLLWTVTITNDKVKFPFGKAQLTSDAIEMLDKLAGKVKDYNKAVYLEIEGHTDSVGGEEYNLMLAEERAEAVRNYLNQKGGIPLHAMSTLSLGESKPVADNSSRQGRAQNRRVVVRVLE